MTEKALNFTRQFPCIYKSNAAYMNGHPWGAQNRAESKEPKTSEKLKHLSKNINLRNPTNSFLHDMREKIERREKD